MLISKKVIDLNEQIKKEKEDKRNECEAIGRILNPLSRKRLEHLNKMIASLSEAIENKTGWIYSPTGFILKTDYTYDPNKEEIVFEVNKVTTNGYGYVPTTGTRYEDKFSRQNVNALDKLFSIEQRRERILSPYKNKYKEFMESYNKVLGDNKPSTKEETKVSYLEIASRDFLSHFGSVGVKRLIDLLNELVDTTYINPIDIYNNQFKSGITSMYVDELFRWAATFNPKAQYIIDCIAKKREELNEKLYLEDKPKAF
jgi:hypothetical protein